VCVLQEVSTFEDRHVCVYERERERETERQGDNEQTREKHGDTRRGEEGGGVRERQ